jgi:septal ring factor EnvC (AmiA/AmiB activator)
MNYKIEVRIFPLSFLFFYLYQIDQTKNMALNERETHYETQIKEYQSKRDQAIRETQDLRTELTKLKEEKTSNEKHLNETLNSSKQDFEKQIQSYQTQITELENQR